MARRHNEDSWDERRTGGAGASTHPLSNGDYRREMDKLCALAAAEDRED